MGDEAGGTAGGGPQIRSQAQRQKTAAPTADRSPQEDRSGRRTATAPSLKHGRLEAKAAGEATPRGGRDRNQQRSAGEGSAAAQEPPAPDRTLLDRELAAAGYSHAGRTAIAGFVAEQVDKVSHMARARTARALENPRRRLGSPPLGGHNI